MPSISFVVTSYNMQGYISACLQSIDDIALDALEIIVVDDGSRDNTVAELGALMPKLHHPATLVRQENAGPGAARNAGLARATGDYICFVDGDDLVVPQEFGAISEILNDHAGCTVSTGFLKWHGGPERGQFMSRSVLVDKAPTVQEKGEAMAQLFASGHFACWGIFFPRERLLAYLNGQALFPVGIIHEDVPGTIKIFAASQGVVFANVGWIQYRQRQGSITHGVTRSRYHDIPVAFGLAWKLLRAPAIWPKAVHSRFWIIFSDEMLSGLRAIRRGAGAGAGARDVLEQARRNLLASGLARGLVWAPGLRGKDRFDLLAWLVWPRLFYQFKLKTNQV